MRQTASAPARLALVTDPPMSRHSVMRVALAGFAFLVGLVLLAAWLGYQGSDRIQETAQALVREKLIQSPRAAEIESLIVRESQQLIDSLAWVLGLCIVLAMGTGAMTVWML